MKIMITGHRPKKIGGYQPNPIQDWIRQKISDILVKAKQKHSDLEVISGMAIGVDQWFVEEAIKLNIPVHAYIPFAGQESKWPKSSRDHYNDLLHQCKSKRIVSRGSYSPEKMQQRNIAMVNDADYCIAVWNGNKGGTSNCVDYVKLKKDRFYWINPKTRNCSWFKRKEK